MCTAPGACWISVICTVYLLGRTQCSGSGHTIRHYIRVGRDGVLRTRAGGKPGEHALPPTAFTGQYQKNHKANPVLENTSEFRQPRLRHPTHQARPARYREGEFAPSSPWLTSTHQARPARFRNRDNAHPAPRDSHLQKKKFYLLEAEPKLLSKRSWRNSGLKTRNSCF